jgi:DNA-binding NarL/FixJ family response regulator
VRLLLVDDSDVYRQTIELVLAREPDIEVVGSAADGTGGRRLSLEARPDVVVLDYRLPGEEGSAVAAGLLADRPDVAVICLTAAATPQERSEVLEAGAAAVVEKGDLEELLAAIRAAGGEAGTPGAHLS